MRTLMSRLLEAKNYYRHCFWSRRKQKLGELLSEAAVRIIQLEQEAAYYKSQAGPLMIEGTATHASSATNTMSASYDYTGNVVRLWIHRG